MSDQNEAIVTIFGSEYRIKTDVDLDRLKHLADLVDEKMREIHKSMSLPSTTKIAVIACLNFLDEYLTRIEELEGREEELKGRLRELIDRLDVALEI
ncbi:cell division protein ZapA [candidate division WOR-3 bacterium]|uniref:Cell division protein ZapA n=1 Tax=candidate division WOR-3 bacterium TaxID=2052148 RepID=A0A660SLY2_UNCW3|nr:MAG: cell division protein ZapA [candidate division WOR-3 bacterium]